MLGGSGPDPIQSAAEQTLKDWLAAQGRDTRTSPQRLAELGVSWLGTKALMWAVEKQLQGKDGGLYDWSQGEQLAPLAWAAAPTVAPDARYLVFIHGTASSTLGSFGDLPRVSGLWSRLRAAYGGNILAFEHRTLSESPIENALQLVRALPRGARVDLVTHSRGGMVGDLLCLTDLDKYVEDFSNPLPGVGPVEPRGGTAGEEADRVLAEVHDQYAEQRALLRELATELQARKIAVERYVRVACPADGTKLARGNFDVFLSGLLALLGAVPALAGPLYAAFARVVLEIAKNRTNPHLVPGIEAMLPESALAALLRRGTPQHLRMAIVAGDVEGGNMLTRLGVLLADHLLFDHVDHDLVVHTESMLGGISSRVQARVLFDRGVGVTHFRYFGNARSSGVVARWLLDEPSAEDATELQPLPQRFIGLDAMGIPARRSADPNAAVVVVLPGIMGSQLAIGDDLVWLDPVELLGGGLHRIRWGASDVRATELFRSAYGDLCEHLAQTHQVELPLRLAAAAGPPGRHPGGAPACADERHRQPPDPAARAQHGRARGAARRGRRCRRSSRRSPSTSSARRRTRPAALRYDTRVQPPRLRMVATSRGDGTVTWEAGRIPGFGRYLFMHGVKHGDLLSTPDYFAAIAGLLETGSTAGLHDAPSGKRDASADMPVLYDPAPPAPATSAALTGAFVDAGCRARPPVRAAP